MKTQSKHFFRLPLSLPGAAQEFQRVLEGAIKTSPLPHDADGYKGVEMHSEKRTDATPLGYVPRVDYWLGGPVHDLVGEALARGEDLAGYLTWRGGPDGLHATLREAGPDRTTVELECSDDAMRPFFDELLREIAARWPESGLVQVEPAKHATTPKNEGRKLGTHGSTMDRVREARELEEQGFPRTTACRRAGIDPRTYDRYVINITCPDNE